jgi:hypothetical protein
VLRGAGPPAPPEEIELAAVLALEAVVLWHGDVLAVRHLRLPGTCVVGGPRSSCDVSLPVELFGAEGQCVALGSRTEAFAVLPGHVRGWVTQLDGTTHAFEAAAGAAQTERLLPLARGQRAHLCFGEIEVQVAAVAAGRAPARPRSFGFDADTLLYFGLSSLSIGGLVAALALLTPPLDLDGQERAAAERVALMRRYLSASLERESKRVQARPAAAAPAAPPATLSSPADDLDPPPRESAPQASADAAPDAEVLDGTPSSAQEREAQAKAARRFGMIGLLESMKALYDPNLDVHRRELGGSELAAMQQMFEGESLGSGPGPSGLALSGTGLGGGGRANVVALGAVRTAGEGQGGDLDALTQAGHITGVQRPAAPRLRAETETARVAASEIRRTVNGSSAQLRACYAPGGPDTAIRVGTALLRFVVKPGGHVGDVDVSGSSAAAAHVRACVARVFNGLSFPDPGASALTVTYPLELAGAAAE